jgi:glucose/arabinose dehydrogenase
MTTLVRIGVLAAITFCAGCNATVSHTESYHIEPVVEGIDVPWGMAWLPNGDLLVTEREGKLFRVRVTDKGLVEIADVPKVHANGQGGMLDVELHPAYEDNGWLYLTYSSPEGSGEGSNTALVRGRLDGDRLIDQEVLYKAEPNTNRGSHYGSRIEFDDDGYLFFSVGDRGARDVNPQDLSRDSGKIYRLHDDGQIPVDNPFVGREGVKEAIYSWGHRNPQGMAKHPETGRIWAHEHGPRGGDEVNIVKAGYNYGWPILSYGINYSGSEFAEGTEREGYESPAWYWVPSIAPSGMTFVTSDKYPDWQGHLLVGSLKFNYLVLCRLAGESVSGQEVLFKNIGRVRNVRQGPDGLIYIGLDGEGIVRIVPKG